MKKIGISMSGIKSFEEPLSSILIFGASGHVASSVVDTLTRKAPEITLRLATSNSSKIENLSIKYPEAEVIECSYLDAGQMDSAMEGMEGLYLITPDFIDMEAAIGNVIRAAKKAKTVRHIVRVSGDVDFDIRPYLPEYLLDTMGTSVGHPIAREMLDKSGLNTTYTNVAAYYMDNLLNHYTVGPIKSMDTVMDVKRHPMYYVDEKEIGEAGANIFMRRNPMDIGAFIHLNNHEPAPDLSEVSKLMEEVFGREIIYLEDKEKWLSICGKDIDEVMGEGSGEYLSQYYLFEAHLVEEADMLGVDSQLEKILDRKPKTLKRWLTDNKTAFDPV